MMERNGQLGSSSWARLDENEADPAPFYDVPSRRIVAVDHPMIVMNLDKGLDMFGETPPFKDLLDPQTSHRPLHFWFRRADPTSRSITSHNTPSHNVLLKVTVPKRTGRKRRKGTQDPFTGHVEAGNIDPLLRDNATTICSISRNDSPKDIRRKLEDNVGKYDIEAVGVIRDTHRYRGLADFQFNTGHNSFVNRFKDQVLDGNLEDFKNFHLNSGIDAPPNVELVPPPQLTDRTLPFHYSYDQNPYVRVEGVEPTTGAPVVVNIQGRKKTSVGHFIAHDQYPVPTGPLKDPATSDPGYPALVARLRNLIEERPIWTRRSLQNAVGNIKASDSSMKIAIQVIGYQFKGGPWRDAIVRYGIDPRSDPEYRQYQTMSFKLSSHTIGAEGRPWELVRRGQTTARSAGERNPTSHIFDGESYCTDGKIWQLCDITDPLMVEMVRLAPVRPTVDDKEGGWFHRGSLAKFKAVMKTKMVAIKLGKMGKDDDDPRKEGFLYNEDITRKMTTVPDVTPPGTPASGRMTIPLPRLPFMEEEELQGSGIRYKTKRRAPLSALTGVVKDKPRSVKGKEVDWGGLTRAGSANTALSTGSMGEGSHFPAAIPGKDGDVDLERWDSEGMDADEHASMGGVGSYAYEQDEDDDDEENEDEDDEDEDEDEDTLPDIGRAWSSVMVSDQTEDERTEEDDDGNEMDLGA